MVLSVRPLNLGLIVELKSHVRCDIQSVRVYLFCWRIPRKSSCADKFWETEEVGALHI